MKPPLTVARGPAAPATQALERRAADLAAAGLPEKEIPSRAQIEEIRRAYVGDLFAMLQTKPMLRSIAQLLKHRDPKIRAKAWETVLMYVLPVSGTPAAGTEGGGGFHLTLVSHIPKPGDVVVQAETRPVPVVGGDEDADGDGTG